MPTYDLACDTCGILYEDFMCSVAERDQQHCDDCGARLRTVIAPVPNTGANWSKPIKVGKQTFATNEEFRSANAKAEAKGYGLVDKTDSNWRSMMDEMSERRESTAQKLGFRNEGHRQQHFRERRAKRA